MNKAIVIFIVLVTLLIGATALVFYDTQKNDHLNLLPPIGKFFDDLNSVSPPSAPATSNVQNFTPGPEVGSDHTITLPSQATGTQTNIDTSLKTKQKPLPPPLAPITEPATTITPCYHYTVTHLDGSTSNRCYTNADYNQLTTLGVQLMTAQGDLDFAQRVYDQDKNAYNTYGGDLFKSAMESAAKKIPPAADKVGQIVLQMQTIEQRGH